MWAKLVDSAAKTSCVDSVAANSRKVVAGYGVPIGATDTLMPKPMTIASDDPASTR